MFALIGGGGYVGQVFQQQLRDTGRNFVVLSRRTVNYYDRDTLISHLKQQNVSFVINCAGYMGKPNVDACEKRKGECIEANAVLPGIIRDACEHLNLPFGHISSGCIYAGDGPDGRGHSENDPPNFCFRTNNCSFYSGCKAMAEEVLADAEQCFIWRIRIPFNSEDSPRNYLSKLLQYDRLLNVRNSLSNLDQFVASCLASWDSRIDFGTYNLTNPGSVTTRDVAELLKQEGLTDKNFSFFDDESEFMTNAASTPRSHCVLDSSRAITAGLPLMPVEDALIHTMRNWSSGPICT